MKPKWLIPIFITINTLCSALLMGWFSPTARACSSFLLADGQRALMGKSYDWHTRDGLLMVNKRDMNKRAFLLSIKRHPLRWKSRYGSVTFNQYGRDLPVGGINEKGLAIEVLWLSSSRTPVPTPTQASINELQWVQYLLDTSATIEEAMSQARKVKIDRAYARVHYLVCDARGRCANFAYLRGKMVIHHNETLPYPAITNDPYAKSLRNYRRYRAQDKADFCPSHGGSLARFCRVAQGAGTTKQQATDQATVDRAFALLNHVRMGTYSKWQIVYELKRRRIHFRPAGGGKTLTIDTTRFDYRCQSPVLIRDLFGTILKNRAKKTQTPHWKHYTYADNYRLVQKSFRRLSAGFPRAVLYALAKFPQSTSHCSQSSTTPTKK